MYLEPDLGLPIVLNFNSVWKSILMLTMFLSLSRTHSRDEVNLDMHDPMPLLIKKNHPILGEIPHTASVAGIEPGTSRTNQFEGECATE